MRVIVEDCKKSKGFPITLVFKLVIPVTILFAFVFPHTFAAVVKKLFYEYTPVIVRHQVENLIAAFGPVDPKETSREGLFKGTDLDQAEQLLLVVVPGWRSSEGKLQRYERPPGSGRWNQDGSSFRVILAESGLAWVDEATYKPAGSQDPIKRRDNTSPAGVFTLGTAFGYDDAKQIENLNYDYLRVNSNIFCVDDESLPQYNRLIELTRNPRITAGLRPMYRKDDLYRLGVVINHNSVDPPNPNLGCCLFLHAWDETELPTKGSTTMSYGNMLEVVRWLKRNKRPILVQITERDRGRIPQLPSQ